MVDSNKADEDKKQENPAKMIDPGKGYVLGIISRLRGRKARPDFNNICRALERLHKYTAEESERCLNRLVDNGCVVMVSYHEEISYRDPAMWTREQKVSGHIVNSEAIVAKLQAAINAIVASAGRPVGSSIKGVRLSNDKQSNGATILQIEKWLISQTGELACDLSGYGLSKVVDREVETGTLELLEDGTYAVGKPVKTTFGGPLELTQNFFKFNVPKVTLGARSPLQNIDSRHSGSAKGRTKLSLKRQRSPSKRKVNLKREEDDVYVFPSIAKKSKKQSPSNDDPVEPQPSEDNPQSLRVDQTGNGPENSTTGRKWSHLKAAFTMCYEEHQRETPNRHEGQEHEMLHCCVCHRKAHPDCLRYKRMIVEQIDRNDWACGDCRQCNHFPRPRPQAMSSTHDSAYSENMKENMKHVTHAKSKPEAESDVANPEEVQHQQPFAFDGVPKSAQYETPAKSQNDAVSAGFPTPSVSSPEDNIPEAYRRLFGESGYQITPNDVFDFCEEDLFYYLLSFKNPEVDRFARILRREEFDGRAVFRIPDMVVLTRFNIPQADARKLLTLLTSLKTVGKPF